MLSTSCVDSLSAGHSAHYTFNYHPSRLSPQQKFIHSLIYIFICSCYALKSCIFPPLTTVSSTSFSTFIAFHLNHYHQNHIVQHRPAATINYRSSPIHYYPPPRYHQQPLTAPQHHPSAATCYHPPSSACHPLLAILTPSLMPVTHPLQPSLSSTIISCRLSLRQSPLPHPPPS